MFFLGIRDSTAGAPFLTGNILSDSFLLSGDLSIHADATFQWHGWCPRRGHLQSGLSRVPESTCTLLQEFGPCNSCYQFMIILQRDWCIYSIIRCDRQKQRRPRRNKPLEQRNRQWGNRATNTGQGKNR